MFTGRTREKREIIDHLTTNKFEYLLVYGIRRVGKTKLVNECLKTIDAKVITYTFRDVPQEVNLHEFMAYIPSCFQESYVTFHDLSGCLTYLCEKAKTEKIVLFIDEYPFLRREDAGIDSYFQAIKNTYEDQAQIKIIFCGSYTNVVTKMIDADAPLYGRFSVVLQLKPFDYYEASLFMGEITNVDKFMYYACFGGLGFTLSNIDFAKPFEENLKHLLIENNSLFEREVSSIINQEINKIPEAKYLLELIGRGVKKYSDINAAFTRMKAGSNVSYLLNKLQELSIIEKVSVINEQKTRNDLYVIQDNLLDFYFTYLSQSVAMRSNMSPEGFYATIREDLFTQYLPKKFKDVTKQFMIKLNKQDLLPHKFTLIGRLLYHDRTKKANAEFDIVLKDEQGYIDIECKYYNRLITGEDYKEECEQLATLGINTMRVGFAAKTGFDETYPQDALHYTLDDFYNSFE